MYHFTPRVKCRAVWAERGRRVNYAVLLTCILTGVGAGPTSENIKQYGNSGHSWERRGEGGSSFTFSGMTQLRRVLITHSTHTNNSCENLRGATRVTRAREEAPEAADGERTDSRRRQLKNDALEYRADGRDRGKEAAGARDALPWGM